MTGQAQIFPELTEDADQIICHWSVRIFQITLKLVLSLRLASHPLKSLRFMFHNLGLLQSLLIFEWLILILIILNGWVEQMW